LLVSFDFRSSQTRVPHNDANFGIGTLVLPFYRGVMRSLYSGTTSVTSNETGNTMYGATGRLFRNIAV